MMDILDFIDECQKANPAAKVMFFIESHTVCIQWRWTIKDKAYTYEVVVSIRQLRDRDYASFYLKSRLQSAVDNMSRCGCDEENNQLR
ncbi:hypothetical protein [Leminorella grimontii]|uniref:hypothetical protein n=1 Tax=Leminorella grimontii TaxID=82981 RepID=UPI00321F6648